jgi:hypothetical protein
VAAVLRLADFIGDEPVTADEIAPSVGAHARSLLPPAPRAVDRRDLPRNR